MLQGAFTVQANVQFSQGSIILAGSIVLINWLGAAVFESLTDELQKQIGEIVRSSVQRVMSLVLSSDSTFGLFKPMNVEVKPKSAATRKGNDIVDASTGGSSSSLTPASILPQDRYLRWILIAIIALFVFQVIVFLDQRITIAPRVVRAAVARPPRGRGPPGAVRAAAPAARARRRHGRLSGSPAPWLKGRSSRRIACGRGSGCQMPLAAMIAAGGTA